MAENPPGEVQTPGLTPPRPTEVPSSQVPPATLPSENPEPDSTEPPAVEKQTPEEVLVDALREFVRQEAGKPKPDAPETIGKRQAAVLILFSIDVALIYSQLDTWMRGASGLAYAEILKIVPWMLGATALTYADRLRQFLQKQAQHMRWAALAAILPMPLLLSHVPIYSFYVQLNSKAFQPNPDDKRVKTIDEGDGLYRLDFPSLDAYRLKITGPEERLHDWEAFPVTLGRKQILLATLAGILSDIPFARRLVRQNALHLEPLYDVPVETDHDAEVDVEGPFQAGFFQEDSLKQARCRDHRAANRSPAVICPLAQGGGAIFLPSGHYNFTLHRKADGCYYPWPNGYDVKALATLDRPNQRNELVDFNNVCAKSAKVGQD